LKNASIFAIVRSSSQIGRAIILKGQMSQLVVGDIAPYFQLNDVNGLPHRLEGALKQGPVALVFYKASCPTCQFTFPFIQKIFAKTGSAGRALWAISQDDIEETRKFATEFGLTFDVLIDEHPYPVSASYGLEFVPGIFLIDQDGKIAVSDYGFTKAGLNGIAGFEFLKANDGLPARRPG
jgi:peroxiredoxin